MRTSCRIHGRIFGAALLILLNLGATSAQDEFRAARPLAVSSLAQLDDIEPGAGEMAALPADTAIPSLSGTTSSLGSFGSVAISAKRLPIVPKWRHATDNDYAALFTDDCARRGLEGCSTRLTKRLKAARESALDRPLLEQLRIVDAAVNAALPYKTDRKNWGRGDYWANPVETALRGAGDCEDYAIAKLWLLRSLGFAPEQLQLVVLHDSRRGLYHAVLVAHVGAKRYVLDNLSKSVRLDDQFPSYLPIVSFVGGRSYIHGFEQQRSDMAAMPSDLAAISPG